METAVILAAGKGTRMLPLTKKIPKVLIQIDNQPFLYYVLENLKEAGYERFGIVAGYMKDQIECFLKKSPYNAEIIEQPRALGTADAVAKAKDFVGEDNFTVLNADNFISPLDYAKMIINDGLMHIGGLKVINPEKYGVLVQERGKLIEIREKPQEFVGDLINTGLYRFTPEIFSFIEKVEKSPRGEFEIVDAISMAAARNLVRVQMIEGYWKDFGCKEDIPKMEEFIRENQLSLPCQRR